MATPIDVPADGARELVLARIIDAPRAAVWRCWSEPDLVCRWFTPAPWTTVSADFDLRPGGSSLVVMRSPEGEDHPNPGVFLAVEPGRRLVFTDAFVRAWEPSGKPFMVGDITFDDDGPATRYIARVRHWADADVEQHLAMGFHEGWGKATDQLEAVARSL
jgi:uncharacterized protein YndB with AHSA1/START domain